MVFEMDARVCSALVERSERGGRRVDRRGGGGEADGESAGGNGEKSSGEGRGDEGVVASIDGDAGGEKQGDDDGSLTEQGGGAEFRAYIWRAMCGPASAAAIGGRSAGDECEESSLRALLRRACLRPLRCDWRDDGVYGAVFPLSEYEVVKAVISKHADVTGLPPAALAFFRSAPVGAAGVLGGEDWRTRLTPALRSSLLPFQVPRPPPSAPRSSNVVPRAPATGPQPWHVCHLATQRPQRRDSATRPHPRATFKPQRSALEHGRPDMLRGIAGGGSRVCAVARRACSYRRRGRLTTTCHSS